MIKKFSSRRLLSNSLQQASTSEMGISRQPEPVPPVGDIYFATKSSMEDESSQAVPIELAQLPCAGLGRRVGAFFIDGLISAIIFLLVVLSMRGLRILGIWTPPGWMPPAGMPPELLWDSSGTAARLLAVLGYPVFLGAFYLAVFEASRWQASLGKRLLDVHITDAAGRRLSISRSLSRSFCKCLFNGFYIGAVSILTVALDPERQALHDKVAKTRVVRGRPAGCNTIQIRHVLAAFGITYLWLVVSCTVLFRSVR